MKKEKSRIQLDVLGLPLKTGSGEEMQKSLIAKMPGKFFISFCSNRCHRKIF